MGRELEPSQLAPNIERFTRLTNDHGVNNFLLRGSPNRGGTPEVYVGCFPLNATGSLVIVHGMPGIEVSQYYRTILELDVPKGQKRIGIEDDRKIRNQIETIAARDGLPSFALVLGHTAKGIRKEVEVAVLYAIAGVSPETALREIQEGLRSGMKRQN